MKKHCLFPLPLLVAACSCPTDFREVPVPHVPNASQASELSNCQVQHYGATLLGQANDAATAKALLEAGAVPQGNLIINGKQYRGTSLWLASAPAVVQALLAAGADANMASGPDRETPLCAAIRNGQAGKAKALLQAGADPNMIDSKGEPPLFLAAGKLDGDLCRALLSHGARPDAGRTADGATPLINALSQGGGAESAAAAKCEVARILLSGGANASLADAEGDTPLHFAPAALIPELQAAGASIHARNIKGRTPLFSGGSIPRTEALLRSGADINAQDYQGNTPFDTVSDASIKSYLLVKGGRSGQAL